MGSTFRGLRNKFPFLLTALTTLAISLGAAVAMFTVVNTFLLSSLPYEGADRLVMVWSTTTEAARQGVDEELPLSPGAYTDLIEQGRSFEQLAGLSSEFVTITGAGEPRRVHLLGVSGDLFGLMRVEASLGRTLVPDDALPEAVPVVVISHGYWQRQFGGDPEVVGRSLKLGGSEHEVVGVLPADFRFAESLESADPRFARPVEVWAALQLGQAARARGFHVLYVAGRLKPGVSLGAAKEEIDAYAAHAAETYPDSDAGYGMRLLSLHDQVFGHLRPALLTLWAATGFLLLIACANLATLLMARGQTAHRDVAVRLAVGASRRRIVAESLIESLTLALAGGLLSLGVAYAATRLLIALNPVHVFHSYPPEIDLTVLAFTVGVSLVAGLLFGAIPAYRASRVDAAEGLRERAALLTRRSRATFSALVVVQLALATTLLIATGLSVRSYVELLRADLGVGLERVVTYDVFLPLSRYRETPRKVELLRQLLERSGELPGVESVGMNYALPLGGVNPSNGFAIEGQPPPEEGEIRSANLGMVNAEYFATLGIPLLRGRLFNAGDNEEAPSVAVVDQRMVDQYFDGEDPLGRRISIASNRPLTIVGVVGAVQHEAFEERPRPYVYLPYQQRSYMFTSLAVKTDLGDPLAIVPSLRAVLRGLDENLPMANVSTLEEAYLDAIAPQRFSLLLMGVIAALALFLTQVGIFGVMSFLAAQRRREVGIRMALGADPARVFALVVRQGLLLSLLGTAAGLLLAVALGRLMASLVYGVTTLDAWVFTVVPLLTLVAAFTSYYLPARALSAVEPGGILRAT